MANGIQTDISEMMDADAYIKAVSAAEPGATTSAGGNSSFVERLRWRK
jgi:hypothetical protein